jgi:hypothetical protein
VKALKDGRFWAGVVVGALVLILFPQVNPRMLTGKKKGKP